MAIKLQDTLTRKERELEAQDGQRYRFYCCGPTVYAAAHIGNFRTFLIQDVLRRLLEAQGMNPYHVRNLTDVDDKTIRRSQEVGMSLEDFTVKWTQKFHEDCEAFNMLKPHEEPTATGHIKEQIEMIEMLIDRGHAYVGGDGSVYFSVKSFKDYGKLAHLDMESLQTQSQNSGGAANLADEYDREAVSDFALWKLYKDEDGPNAWDSPWGKGRPGWHIECSAMSRKYLGDTFDLHAGGVDLCFPHHENEIAQSEGATGKPFCNHWFHSAHLQVEGEKMSKSLGNMYNLDDIREKGYSANVLRYLLISGHYKQPLNFTLDGLKAAESAIQKLERFVTELLAKISKTQEAFDSYVKQEGNWGRFEPVHHALCDDMNTPSALGELFKGIKVDLASMNENDVEAMLNELGKVMYVLGVELFRSLSVAAPQEVEAMAQARWEAKQAKDFAKADQLRGEIEATGWKVLDAAGGYGVRTFKIIIMNTATMEDRKQMSPLEELRHSSAHVLATAVLRLFPDAKIDIGPPTDNGFYYDFDLDHKFTAEDLEKIEAQMKKIIKENQRFERKEVSREEAAQFFEESNQPYKLSRLDDIPQGAPISLYTNGEFTDLCAGTHVKYTKQIKAVKLLHTAGAYYRGDEKNQQMQRIYGTAFPSKDELETYLQQLEEAKQRDHRKLGKELKLYVIDESVGQGLILWAPNGAILRKELQNFISKQLVEQGYEEVFTPHIGKLDLYRTSGHYPYYSDSQFPAIVERDSLEKMAQEEACVCELTKGLEDGQLEGFLLKPMNCPMHSKIYASQARSYRDLPVRLAEFGTVYRWEQSGELNGMTRVRGFTQDDAHIFCMEDQVGEEIQGCLSIVKNVLSTLGMRDYRVRVSLRDPDSTKYIGSSEQWDKAEESLRQAAKGLGVPFTEEPGEAAFYGPKIDFVVKDVIGREWQLGTVQVDYNLPERFDLKYTGSDNKEHRPVMIHRAPFGSMERFTGVLIEHFGGNFPTWLAPEQVRILCVSDDFMDHAAVVEQALLAVGIRVKIDSVSDKLGAKIRRAEMDKVPYMVIVGAKEKESGGVSIRSRTHKSKDGDYSLEDFVKLVVDEVQTRQLPESFNQ